ncbi:MAG: mobile mystery protein B [Coxiellaceae bacterium]|nr:mobile mystery protein B [Coxiellaceae bacterium]
MQFDYPTGATPLDPDEVAGLIPLHISTQGQLNEWEQQNIIDAEVWAFSRKFSNVLTLEFCKQLHKKMFDKTWSWAGSFRQSNKNIGGYWECVPQELTKLFDDLTFQMSHKTYSMDEALTRFHHRLVYIHPFPNGNGRHARLMTDLILFQHDCKRFTWGSQAMLSHEKTRNNYIEALRKSDRGDYSQLIRFVRS